DGRLSLDEIDDLVRIASDDGVSVTELEQIVHACEQSETGFEPAQRAHLYVRLAGLLARDALAALAQFPARAGEQRLAETEMRVQILAGEVGAARDRLTQLSEYNASLFDAAALAAGELRPAAEAQPERFADWRTQFTKGQATLVQSTRLLIATLS